MPDKIAFPELDYKEILPTRDTIHGYAQFAGAIRSSMTPFQKDYRHISLRTAPLGFRTTPIPAAGGHTFEILLDLISHSLAITTSKGYTWSMPVEGQSLALFSHDVLAELDKLGISPGIEIEKYKDDTDREYNLEYASEIFRAFRVIDMILKEFQGSLARETSPVQLWPHHLDIAFSCYPAPESRQIIEQISCGYLTGDASIEEPYFYITVYPELEDISGIELCEKAYWHAEEWQGVIYRYRDLISAASPKQELLDHLKTTFDQILKKV